MIISGKGCARAGGGKSRAVKWRIPPLSSNSFRTAGYIGIAVAFSQLFARPNRYARRGEYQPLPLGQKQVVHAAALALATRRAGRAAACAAISTSAWSSSAASRAWLTWLTVVYKVVVKVWWGAVPREKGRSRLPVYMGR